MNLQQLESDVNDPMRNNDIAALDAKAIINKTIHTDLNVSGDLNDSDKSTYRQIDRKLVQVYKDIQHPLEHGHAEDLVHQADTLLLQQKAKDDRHNKLRFAKFCITDLMTIKGFLGLLSSRYFQEKQNQ